MTNPFTNETSPAVLMQWVRDGVECEMCMNTGGTNDCPCPHCDRGRVPLSNGDLDALAACWCEGEWVFQYESRSGVVWRMGHLRSYVPAYTTSPGAAMRLQEKYRISTQPTDNPDFDHWWADALGQQNSDLAATTLCRAITEAALLATLAEAIS